MKKKLEKLLKKSYSPYSNVKVAAILIDKYENQFEGINIENAAFSPSVCAERCAIFNFLSSGNKKEDIKEMHLISSLDMHLFPCGVCLQVMSEFFNKEIKIFIYNINKENIIKKKFGDLMPNILEAEFF